MEKRATILTDLNPLFGTDWNRRLGHEFEKPYWAGLQAFVEEQRSRHDVYPPHDEVFTALHLTRHAKTKVVILGQDPYPGAGQAHGLCFSVRLGVPVPRSLVNIHRELREDLGLAIPGHGNLEPWARRGVLLLNATLTVRAGAPASHRHKGWETFTNEVIRVVDAKTDPVVFILGGRTPSERRRSSTRPGTRSSRRRIRRPNPRTRASSGASRSAGRTTRSSRQGGKGSIGG